MNTNTGADQCEQAIAGEAYDSWGIVTGAGSFARRTQIGVNGHLFHRAHARARLLRHGPS